MNDIKDQEWVIEEDELALENSILNKYQDEKEPKPEKKKKNIVLPSEKKPIIEETKEAIFYIDEKVTFFFLFTIFPYILGTFLFFIVIPLWTGIDIKVFFLSIDFLDWVTHFLLWSIGYITLTLSGFSFLLYQLRH